MKAFFGILVSVCIVAAFVFVGTSSEAVEVQKKGGSNRRIGGGHRKIDISPKEKIQKIGHFENHDEEAKFDHASFDPEAAHHNGEFDEGFYDDWYGDDDYGYGYHFNITERLIELFPSIDENTDGKVSLQEMEDWHFEQGMNSTKMRSEREFLSSDVDANQLVTLEEYLGDDFHLLKDFDEGKVDPEGDDHYNIDWVTSARTSFGLADLNHDGYLDRQEFFDMLHPEESNNESLMNDLNLQIIRDRDNDSDLQLDAQEFYDNLWWEIKPPEEFDLNAHSDYGDYGDTHDEESFHDFQETSEPEPAAIEKFKELDANKDGYVTATELAAVSSILHPTERDFAQRQASHMVEMADADGDHYLTLEEMLENPYVFYSAADPDQDSYYYHDEFHH
mmetsp:Transcript_31816/g.38472  ORF Transcript_31816/g.38472 Transcript_31816/m.38472 type:complete len:391 (-) Transcript_31816:400-1572(-)|eukprot:CAMPEP_0197860102 /NCGR_PEP_ID=MMETSP1438-20131217/35248_1 /TAXON_ID=1461541 /ORGANISM="Pterosperma sp., Strain CCMP1384" /LENGTH=390 /DNA_ID=CAMNT_0043476855 /DNA_START=340 /DNA_END=1512 /DNA_ORIENTATION=+